MSQEGGNKSHAIRAKQESTNEETECNCTVRVTSGHLEGGGGGGLVAFVHLQM